MEDGPNGAAPLSPWLKGREESKGRSSSAAWRGWNEGGG